MSAYTVLRSNLQHRPVWMNALMLFCAYMAVLYVPWDFAFKPVATDQEVWFGVVLTGWWAKLTEPLHWAIYAAGVWGFWYMKAWMHPWALLYTAQIAIGMLIWNLTDDRGAGLTGALVSAVPFCVLCVFLWRDRARFSNKPDSGAESIQ
ncbi:MAG: hypothetical protein WD772_00630 [Pseudohongiellaceae bacterium]